jgi:hypothetical protein
MNTNPGSGVNQNMLSSNFVGKFFNSITKSITESNLLNNALHTGAWNLPYAVMGMVTIVAGTFTYVTYNDYINDIGESVSETVDSLKDFSPFSEDSPSSSNPNDLGIFESNADVLENKPAVFGEIGDLFKSDENAKTNIEPPEPNVVPKAPEPVEPPKNSDIENQEPKPVDKKAEQFGEKYTIGGNADKSRRSLKKKGRKTLKKRTKIQ